MQMWVLGALNPRSYAGPLLLVLLICAPAVFSQELSPELVKEASNQTGLSEEEILRRYRETSGAGPEHSSEPGLKQLPKQEAPVVILPLDQVPPRQVVKASDGMPIDNPKLSGSYFGADFFKGDPGLFGSANFGPVPRDYIIGPGDQIQVDVWGEAEFRHERVVDRQGNIILPKAGKILCANRTLEHVNATIRKKLSIAYSGIDPEGLDGTTFVDVTLGQLHAIRVFVVGEATRPGAYELTSIATVFTALYAAGGPGPLGSMRDIRLMRNGEQVASLDLYDYLLTGIRHGDAILYDGDTVFVTSRKVTVDIRGSVNRPLKYELVAGEILQDLVEFAGGFTAEAETQLVHVERILPPAIRNQDEPDRVLRDLDLGQESRYELRDGDRVKVDRITNRLENWVEVAGNVKRPGRYETTEDTTVRMLIEQAGGLWDDTLLERATIARIAPDGSFLSMDLPLGKVLRAEVEDPVLQGRDVLRVFSIWDLKDRYRVTISGAVRNSGSFEWRQGLTLSELILKAGGLDESADVQHIEVSRLSEEALNRRDPGEPPEISVDVSQIDIGEDWLLSGDEFELKPHDQVAIRKLPWWELQRTVTVRGEVGYPGDYTISRPDERLSDLIKRAGGLKPTAYAPGARIIRKKDKIGNVALDLHKAIDRPGSEHDAILEDGDDIRIPPKLYTVKVVGAVGYPTSIVWENGKSLGDYVNRAGGYSEGADKWKTQVVYPNGISKPIQRFWSDPSVKPGSTIVVPDSEPDGDATRLETMKEIASIFASVATVWLVIDRTN